MDGLQSSEAMGSQYVIIDPNFIRGHNVYIGNFVHIRPNVTIGDDSEIRDYCFIAEGAKIGRNTIIYQYSDMCAGIIVGDYCFIGVGCITGNDKIIAYPDKSKFIATPPIIEDRVRVGLHCAILPGVMLAEGCVIGAGSVVTKSTEPWKTYAGNPAREIPGLNDKIFK